MRPRAKPCAEVLGKCCDCHQHQHYLLQLWQLAGNRFYYYHFKDGGTRSRWYPHQCQAEEGSAKLRPAGHHSPARQDIFLWTSHRLVPSVQAPASLPVSSPMSLRSGSSRWRSQRSGIAKCHRAWTSLSPGEKPQIFRTSLIDDLHGQMLKSAQQQEIRGCWMLTSKMKHEHLGLGTIVFYASPNPTLFQGLTQVHVTMKPSQPTEHHLCSPLPWAPSHQWMWGCRDHLLHTTNSACHLLVRALAACVSPNSSGLQTWAPCAFLKSKHLVHFGRTDYIRKQRWESTVQPFPVYLLLVGHREWQGHFSEAWLGWRNHSCGRTAQAGEDKCSHSQSWELYIMC